MKALLIEKTKQEKIMNEVQKKRNLFGLGLTSLIAACAADDAGNGATVDIGTIPQTGLEAEPLGAVTLTQNTHFTTARIGGTDSRADKSDLVVTVKKTSAVVDDDSDVRRFIATFKDGDHTDPPSAEVSGYKDLAVAGQNDLVVSSKEFGDPGGTTKTGGIYILWNINRGGDIGVIDVDASNKKFLKVAGDTGDVLPDDAPLFYKDLGVEADHDDMVFRSGGDTNATATSINILWDVTQYAGAKKELDVTSNEILQVKGVGTAAPEFTKINNNDGYDMIVQGTGSTYILWDVANYHNANPTVQTPQTVVNLATDVTAAATATHGLLTIKGAITDIHKATAMVEGEAVDNGFTDINEGGINDLAFVHLGNTYILFGEKVADRDGEKAKSYSVDLTEVATFFGSDTTKAGFFSAKDSTGADVAQAGYRFAAADQTTLDDLDAITTEYAKVEAPALSEEAYWDIA